MFLAASADVLILARIELACRRGLYLSDGSGSRCMKNIRLNAVEVWIGWWPLKRAVSVDDSVAAAAYLRGESRGAEKRRIFIRCMPWLQSGMCKGDKRYLTGTTEAADPEVTSLSNTVIITTTAPLLRPQQWPRLSPVPTPPTSPAWACLQRSQQPASGQSHRHSARRRSQALRCRSLSSPRRRRRGRAARHPHASPSRSLSSVQCARPRAASPSRTNTQRRGATRPCRLRPVCVY